MDHAQRLIATIPWGMKAWPLPGLQASSHIGFIAKFLSWSWLNERNMNLMAVCCNSAVMGQGGKPRDHVALCYFGSQLQGISGWMAERIKENVDLGWWGTDAAEKGYRYIHIPISLANTHWVVYRIDIEERTYCWGLSLALTYVKAPTDSMDLGDSMGGSSYSKLMDVVRSAIERWTEAIFGTSFSNQGRVYKMGNQADVDSCGVCVINAIDASIHGTELFTNETRSMHRLRQFITAAEYLLEDTVRPLPVQPCFTCSLLLRTRLKWIWRPSSPRPLESSMLRHPQW